MAHKIDLDAAERDRTAKIAKALEIDWKGHTYQLPVEQPMEVARHFRKLADYSDNMDADKAKPDGTMPDGKLLLTQAALDQCYDDGLSVLFCTCAELPFPDDDHPGKREHHATDCEWVRFLRTVPSSQTRFNLVTQLNQAYNTSPGKAPARTSSRKNTGQRSQPTGKRSTAKTSQTKSGAGAAKKTATASRRRSASSGS